MRLRCLWILLGVIMTPAMAGAAVSVQASVDRTVLAPGESLILQVSVSGGKGEVDTDGIDDFKVVSRGSRTSVQVVNGQISEEKAYTFTLIPVREGRLTIPPLPVHSGGDTYHTREIALSVSRTPANPGAGAREVVVAADVSENAPYEGQQIRYTFRVRQRVRIANAAFQRPDFKGFDVRELEERKEYSAVYDGLEYHVTEVNFLLIPMGSGARSIDGAVLTCDIVRPSGRRRSVFEDPFFNLRGDRMESRVFRAEPVSVTVKPLPPYGGPKKFSGLVGRFDIDAGLAASDVRVGDSTTLTVTVRGTGNIMDAGPPEIPVGDAVKVYGDTPEEEIRVTDEGYSGRKVFRSALVPVKAGTYELGPVEWVYFDTSKGEYLPLETPTFTLRVRPPDRQDASGGVSAASPDHPAAKEAVAFIGRDILPLKDGMDAVGDHRPLSPSVFLAVLLLPVLLWGAVRFCMTRLKADADASRTMAGRAEKALREAASRSASDEDYFGCLYRGLVSAVLSRAGVAGESLTYAEVSKILMDRGFTRDAAEAAARLLERIESAGFSGVALDPRAGEALFEEVRRTVREILG